jgi:hypothetical protein
LSSLWWQSLREISHLPTGENAWPMSSASGKQRSRCRWNGPHSPWRQSRAEERPLQGPAQTLREARVVHPVTRRPQLMSMHRGRRCQHDPAVISAASLRQAQPRG